MLKALLQFHFRVGVRVAIRASPPLFCIIVAGILFQDPPSAFVTMVARAAYSSDWPLGVVLPIAAIAFLLPAWGSSRLGQSLNGWTRHLPLSAGMNLVGLWLALVSVQLPLAIMLTLLGLIAARSGLPIGWSALRWAFVLAAGAAASLALRGVRRSRTWRPAGVLISWHIAWRAVGLRIIPSLAAGLAMIEAGRLFISNNGLQGSWAAAAARLAGSLACAFSLSGLCSALASRRPAWPLARSFPWSTTDRIIDDSFFFAVHAVPFVLWVVWISPAASLPVLSLVPFMSVRAAEFVREIPGRRAAVVAYLGEAAGAGTILTLVPWSALFWLLVTVWALRSAAECERRLRSTDWFELHHEISGDTSAWSSS
jgi:hypothetical protein